MNIHTDKVQASAREGTSADMEYALHDIRMLADILGDLIEDAFATMPPEGQPLQVLPATADKVIYLSGILCKKSRDTFEAFIEGRLS